MKGPTASVFTLTCCSQELYCGGDERAVRMLAKGLRHAGHDPLLSTTTWQLVCEYPEAS